MRQWWRWVLVEAYRYNWKDWTFFWVIKVSNCEKFLKHCVHTVNAPFMHHYNYVWKSTAQYLHQSCPLAFLFMCWCMTVTLSILISLARKMAVTTRISNNIKHWNTLSACSIYKVQCTIFIIADLWHIFPCLCMLVMVNILVSAIRNTAIATGTSCLLFINC